MSSRKPLILDLSSFERLFCEIRTLPDDMPNPGTCLVKKVFIDEKTHKTMVEAFSMLEDKYITTEAKNISLTSTTRLTSNIDKNTLLNFDDLMSAMSCLKALMELGLISLETWERWAHFNPRGSAKEAYGDHIEEFTYKLLSSLDNRIDQEHTEPDTPILITEAGPDRRARLKEEMNTRRREAAVEVEAFMIDEKGLHHIHPRGEKDFIEFLLSLTK